MPMAPAAPPGKPRCCLREGERRQDAHSCRQVWVSNILPAGMHCCRQESIPACRNPILPADNTWACRGAPPAPWIVQR